MAKEFKWTDELVQEFAREITKGQNAMFKGCPKLTDKVKAFKRIHTKPAKPTESYGGLGSEWDTGIAGHMSNF